VAEKFVRDLANDPQVGGMIHCNLEKLDVQLGVAGNAARNRSVYGIQTSTLISNSFAYESTASEIVDGSHRKILNVRVTALGNYWVTTLEEWGILLGFFGEFLTV
jgi:hypothetical protein